MPALLHEGKYFLVVYEVKKEIKKEKKVQDEEILNKE